MVRSLKEILRLAQQAAKFALDEDEGYDRMRFLALEEGMKRETLEYYGNAYQAAGESGVRALTYKKPMPEEVRLTANRVISEYFSAQLPQNEHVGKLWFQVVAQCNQITVAERRPFYNDPSQSTTSEFCQLRYTDYDKRWHLYWKRASGKWWPYIGKREMKSVEDCLREIERDDSGCFLG